MENIVKYEVSIEKDTTTKNLYFYSTTVDGQTVSGQALGVGEAMMKASDRVHEILLNAGRIK